MKLTTAMLADDAFVASNGKLYIHGGVWTCVLSQTFPATHPKMAVVLVLEVDYGEALQNHTVEVVLLKDGEPVGPRCARDAECRSSASHKAGSSGTDSDGFCVSDADVRHSCPL